MNLVSGTSKRAKYLIYHLHPNCCYDKHHWQFFRSACDEHLFRYQIYFSMHIKTGFHKYNVFVSLLFQICATAPDYEGMI